MAETYKSKYEKLLAEVQELYLFINRKYTDHSHYSDDSHVQMLRKLKECWAGLEKATERSNMKYASLVESVMIYLKSLIIIAKTCYDLTHRQRHARLDVLRQTIEETLQQLSECRDNPYMFEDGCFWYRNDWDFRQVCAENRKLKNEVDKLKTIIQEVNHANYQKNQT